MHISKITALLAKLCSFLEHPCSLFPLKIQKSPTTWENCNLCEDGILDGFDLEVMKRLLMAKGKKEDSI